MNAKVNFKIIIVSFIFVNLVFSGKSTWIFFPILGGSDIVTPSYPACVVLGKID